VAKSAKSGMFTPVSEEMKRLGALLAAELETWPGVSVRPMFGMLGVWRGKRIFAALPRTRSLGRDNAVLLKFSKMTAKRQVRMEAEPRFGEFSFGGKAKWHRFRVQSEREISDLLAWLAEAYEE
jgi:hypothetical protein